MGTKWTDQNDPAPRGVVLPMRPRPGRDLWMIDGADLFAQVLAALRPHQPHTGPLINTDDTTDTEGGTR